MLFLLLRRAPKVAGVCRDDSMMAGRCRRRWPQRDAQGWLNITRRTGGDNEVTRQLGMRCSEGQRGKVVCGYQRGAKSVWRWRCGASSVNGRSARWSKSVMVIPFCLVSSLTRKSTCGLLPVHCRVPSPWIPTLMLESLWPHTTASCSYSSCTFWCE